MTLKIGDPHLKIADLVRAARSDVKIECSNEALKRIEESNLFLKNEMDSGKSIYGVNTGFGALSNTSINRDDLSQLQVNLLRSHACGVGELLSQEIVRAMFILRAHTLALGHSGVSLNLIQHCIACINNGIFPVIPSQGSVGASGDLAPLSHLALVLIGEGEAVFQGVRMEGAQALKKAGLKPINLGPKEGLSLINGTQMMTALGCLLIEDCKRLLEQAHLAAAMTVEAMKGSLDPFLEEVSSIRPHPGQVDVAKKILSYLSDPKPSDIHHSHENCGKIQDPYSLRCVPQVHGVVHDTISFVEKILNTEINSVTDNPLVFARSKKMVSAGNFHGEYVACAMDFLSIALSELANISEQRISKLMNPAFSGLPAFLTEKLGLNSGFMMVHVLAAALVSENKTLAHPASVDSIPTSTDKEDHVSMGAWAARKAQKILHNVEKVVAIEFLCAAQGIDLLRPLMSTKAIENAHHIIRSRVAKLKEDRSLSNDIEKIIEMMRNQEGLSPS